MNQVLTVRKTLECVSNNVTCIEISNLSGESRNFLSLSVFSSLGILLLSLSTLAIVGICFVYVYFYFFTNRLAFDYFFNDKIDFLLHRVYIYYIHLAIIFLILEN